LLVPVRDAREHDVGELLDLVAHDDPVVEAVREVPLGIGLSVDEVWRAIGR
jgi:hypothetical protein